MAGTTEVLEEQAASAEAGGAKVGAESAGAGPSVRSTAPDFVTELQLMSAEQRLAGYRAGLFTLAQSMTWAARYPDEAPLVNGELEWIALTLADLD